MKIKLLIKMIFIFCLSLIILGVFSTHGLISQDIIKPMLFCEMDKIQYKIFKGKLYLTNDAGLNWEFIQNISDSKFLNNNYTNAKADDRINILSKMIDNNQCILEINSNIERYSKILISNINGVVINEQKIVVNSLRKLTRLCQQN